MKFSIITPTYNQASFIRETFDSIIAQEGDFEIEMIVMDGLSTDATVDILKEYEKKLKGNDRITFIWKSEKDRGQTHAINKGLQLATGDILAYLNSDDYYLPGAFVKVAKALSDPKAYWLYGLCQIVDEKGKPMRGIIEQYRNAVGKRYGFSKLMIINYIAQPAAFWKKEAYEKVGDFKEDEQLVMDYEYWCRLGKVYPAVSLYEYVAAFRMHGSSKSMQQFAKQFEEKQLVAARYTNNSFLLGLAKIHDWLTVAVYKLIS